MGRQPDAAFALAQREDLALNRHHNVAQLEGKNGE